VISVCGCLALLAAVTVLFSILALKVSQASRVSRRPTCYRLAGQPPNGA